MRRLPKPHRSGFSRDMIVCSCNVLSDHQVRHALNTDAPRSATQVHRCLGCSAKCGRCMRSIRKIMDEALDGAVAGCPVGCACAAHAPRP